MMKIKKMMNMINMKIKTISLAFVSLAMLSVSCNDEFLEIGATGSLAEAQMVTQEGIDGVLIGAYSALNGVFGNRFEAPSHWVTGSVAGGQCITKTR
jgi:delta-aminolevulinic acid dehydratase/porphobilinogen synthase